MTIDSHIAEQERETASQPSAQPPSSPQDDARAGDPPRDKPAGAARVLVVDDEYLVRWSLRQRLEKEGYEVVEAENAAEATARFREGVDLALLDYRLPDSEGLEPLKSLRRIDESAPVIMLTAHSSIEMAVAAMKEGAYHYASKPFNLDEVVNLIDKALESSRLKREVRSLLEQRNDAYGLHRITGQSSGMRRVRELVKKIAATPASTVLITGESGTGKDLVARAIHNHSRRAQGPFMNITCSTLSDTLLESELFGHERGAFTDAKQLKRGLLEQADGGTVFLDEIGEMSPGLQAKLLRFLEEKAFRRVGGSTDLRPDVRVIAATHRDLKEQVRQAGFRSDLYYRLAVLHVHMPALRERGDDIELLAKCFIDEFDREFGKHVQGLTPDALRLIKGHEWPGNVRELKNTLERAMLLADDKPRLEASDFQMLSADDRPEGQVELPPGGIDLREVERDLVVQALERAGGNQSRAARLLGISRDQVRYRVAKFGLHANENGDAQH